MIVRLYPMQDLDPGFGDSSMLSDIIKNSEVTGIKNEVVGTRAIKTVKTSSSSTYCLENRIIKQS